MNLNEFIKNNPEINITIKGSDLMECNKKMADQILKSYLERKTEKLYTPKEVETMFNICPASRWRWTKMGLLQGKRIGNRLYYPESGIKEMLNRKGGEK